MTNIIKDLESLSKSYGLQVKDCGGGHWQVYGRGNLVNYWPESKAKTAQLKGHKGIKNCLPFDVVKLAIGQHSKKDEPKLVRPKATKVIEKQKTTEMLHYSKGTTTNPAGIKHFYHGELPPWSDELFPCMAASDLLRIDAHNVRCHADMLAFMANEQDAVKADD